MAMNKGPVSQFIEHHYRHFNAAALVDAAKGYEKHLAEGGKMLVTLAGAMSTAELGISLAEMIRQDKIQAISCTGANLEEDIMNLVAHNHYERIPNWRDLTPQKGERYFPHEFMYKLLLSGVMKDDYQIDPKNSWMIAAAEKNLPIVVGGWEDSTMGNIFASYVYKGEIKASTMKSGIEYMVWLANYYKDNSAGKGIGFFQIGGGIAGDFPICVVPMMYQDLEMHEIPFWSYFCQISDSTTSYGSYSGAHPNEKITWGKLDIHTPKYIIESDATIVAPLVFAWLLGW